MSKRVIVSMLVGLLTAGAFTAGGIALADSGTGPSLENASARFVAPASDKAGSLTFTADVSDDAGVLDLKVLVWPASSKLDPTETELELAENAKCVSTSDETVRCTYTLTVTEQDAAESAKGTWHVSALATANDGDRTFAPKAASFDITD